MCPLALIKLSLEVVKHLSITRYAPVSDLVTCPPSYLDKISVICFVLTVRFGVRTVRFGVLTVRFGVLTVRCGVLTKRYSCLL